MRALLSDILYKTNLRFLQGSTQIEVEDVQIDSRRVGKGSLFVALKGAVVDGHQYIAEVIEKGAVAVVVEELPDQLVEGVTYIGVANSHEAAGRLAHHFYGSPSEKLQLVGVTGTNGKTTIATLLYKLFKSLGYTCGLVSTVNNRIGNEVLPATHTTPDAIQLNKLLAEMVAAGCTHVFMECSSHAIHQHRIAGLSFAGGIFSNITHDHLDYHKTFDAYIKAKKKFFDDLPAAAFAITNLDDKRGMVMLQNTHARKLGYSLRSMAEFKGKILENGLAGLQMSVNDQEVHFRLIGEFNAYNLLAIYGAAISLGEEKQEVLRLLSMMTGAEGRFDYQVSKKEGIIAIVDYAHTPDALLNVLNTIKGLRKGNEQVITVVGCGGDRDRAKRPVMAEVAAELSDRLILTSDNPRTEDPEQILLDMEAGLQSAGKRKSLKVSDRREAIKIAVSLAREGDIILVEGKGHEKYQEINGVKHPFDDRQVLNELMELFDK